MRRRRLLVGLRVALLVAVIAAAIPSTNASAFTLIGSGVTKLFIRPSNAQASAPFNVLATWQTQSQCFPSPGPVTFRFVFDSTEVWFTNVNVCDPNLYLWGTGWSPNLKPPAPGTPGAHKITVTVYAPPGNTPMPGNTATGTYTINRPPPSPSPAPPKSPTPQASPSAAATPTTSQCSASSAATLPSAGTGGFVDNFIASAMVLAVLPILGLALFGSPAQFLAAAGRRRKLLQVLGLSLLVVGVLSCTSTVAQGPASPVAAVSPSQGPSPSPSPSPSC